MVQQYQLRPRLAAQPKQARQAGRRVCAHSNQQVAWVRVAMSEPAIVSLLGKGV
jgi:alkylated DNA nucleotide flippase Atl1